MQIFINDSFRFECNWICLLQGQKRGRDGSKMPTIVPELNLGVSDISSNAPKVPVKVDHVQMVESSVHDDQICLQVCEF